MKRKVFRAGNSAVVALPPEAMESAGIVEGHEVSVEYDPEHGGILIRAVKPIPPGIDEAFARQVAGFVERYRAALDALARHEPPQH